MERATPLICPRCGSKKSVSFLYVEPASRPRIFVYCAECEEFLARVTISQYASFETYDSVLTNLSYAQRGGFASAREVEGIIEHLDGEVRASFARALKVLREHPVLPVPE